MSVSVSLCLGVLSVGNRSLYRGLDGTAAYVRDLFDAVLVGGEIPLLKSAWDLIHV
jgi:hypothetical protein